MIAAGPDHRAAGGRRAGHHAADCGPPGHRGAAQDGPGCGRPGHRGAAQEQPGCHGVSDDGGETP
jgi:hypothetical protein